MSDRPVPFPRRRVLGAGAAGITSLALPSAAAASSDVGSGSVAPGVPTIASAVPAGYVLTDGVDENGAIDVSWGAVGTATSYVVSVRTPSGSGTYVVKGTTSGTSLRITGLSGAATYDVVVAASNPGGTSADSEAETAVGTVVASGGTVTSYEDGVTRYVVHTFTTVGSTSLSLARARDVEHLVVGGGGGGGRGFASDLGGGGGGGGQVVTGTLSRTGEVEVIVGAGGAARASSDPGRGGTSSLGDTSAAGGGGGGWYQENATSGSSGGGGGARYLTTGATWSVGAAGTPGQGFAGGSGDRNNGGGGGGAGGVGQAHDAVGAPSGGGAGVASAITGTSRTYGAGGGGGRGVKSGTGASLSGPGVGGAVDSGDAGAGEAGTGGGGGGGAGAGGSAWWDAGAGGSGVVIVRYAL